MDEKVRLAELAEHEIPIGKHFDMRVHRDPEGNITTVFWVDKEDAERILAARAAQTEKV